MDFLAYRNIIKDLSIGKKLPDSVYLHKSALKHLPEALQSLVSSTAKQFNILAKDWNIIKFYKKIIK